MVETIILSESRLGRVVMETVAEISEDEVAIYEQGDGQPDTETQISLNAEAMDRLCEAWLKLRNK